MFNKNKKIELAKKDALTLSLVQFCAKLTFEEEMFFSQISIRRSKHSIREDYLLYFVEGMVFSSNKDPLDLDMLGVVQHPFAGFIEIKKNQGFYLVKRIEINFNPDANKKTFYWDLTKDWILWKDNNKFKDFLEKLENIL